MALTLEMEQRLDRAGLVTHYGTQQAAWQAVAQTSYDFIKGQFGGAAVRPDDIAKVLRPVVEINKDLRIILDSKKLSQKYWIDYFTNLIIDRTWAGINK